MIYLIACESSISYILYTYILSLVLIPRKATGKTEKLSVYKAAQSQKLPADCLTTDLPVLCNYLLAAQIDGKKQ